MNDLMSLVFSKSMKMKPVLIMCFTIKLNRGSENLSSVFLLPEAETKHIQTACCSSSVGLVLLCLPDFVQTRS